MPAVLRELIIPVSVFILLAALWGYARVNDVNQTAAHGYYRAAAPATINHPLQQVADANR